MLPVRSNRNTESLDDVETHILQQEAQVHIDDVASQLSGVLTAIDNLHNGGHRCVYDLKRQDVSTTIETVRSILLLCHNEELEKQPIIGIDEQGAVALTWLSSGGFIRCKIEHGKFTHIETNVHQSEEKIARNSTIFSAQSKGGLHETIDMWLLRSKSAPPLRGIVAETKSNYISLYNIETSTHATARAFSPNLLTARECSDAFASDVEHFAFVAKQVAAQRLGLVAPDLTLTPSEDATMKHFISEVLGHFPTNLDAGEVLINLYDRPFTPCRKQGHLRFEVFAYPAFLVFDHKSGLYFDEVGNPHEHPNLATGTVIEARDKLHCLLKLTNDDNRADVKTNYEVISLIAVQLNESSKGIHFL